MSSNNNNPRILLVRPEYHTSLTRFAGLVTEPLELEYLAAVSNQMNCEHLIHDPVLTGKSYSRVLSRFKPDIVAITGYYPAKDAMIQYASFAKKANPQTLAIIGGVHAELNCADFYNDSVDLVVHSGGTDTFSRILEAVKSKRKPHGLAGTCYQAAQGEWRHEPMAPFDPEQLPQPDRTHFSQYKDRLNYPVHGRVALLKSAYGCRFKCSFCCCRLLNQGNYSCMSIEKVVNEIETIDCRKIWITDDCFLLEKDRIQAFADELKRRSINRDFIIYGRADFIANNPDIVPLLQQIGVVDVIVGLEAVDDTKLRTLNKGVSTEENLQCVKLLGRHNIQCTGLFLMNPDAEARDFTNLNKWIKKTNLATFTVSIFSPFPGTAEYNEYRNKLTTKDCRKWDLMHLVMQPDNMSRLMFYARMLRTHLGMLIRNKKMRRHILGLLAGNNRGAL